MAILSTKRSFEKSLMLNKLLTFLFLTISQTCLFGDHGISLADDYRKNSSLQWEWAIDSLEHFSFNSDDTILDVGCGDGKITSLIADHLPQGQVTGLDISEKMIRLASFSFKQGNLLFIQGDATAIPYQEQFDKIVSFCALHWVVNQKQALISMKEALKQNGMMLLVFPGKGASNLATVAEKIAMSEKWISFFPNFKQERAYFTVDEYKELLKEANLNIQSIAETDSWTIYENKTALIKWLRPLINFINHLDAEQQFDFIEEMADAMIANHPSLEGVIRLHDTKIEVIATKSR